ncbi:MAG: TonB-dependent receptor [Steroidobacteraceae bacterium]
MTCAFEHSWTARVGTLVLALAAGPALAQVAATRVTSQPSDTAPLEEVVVTAERRPELLLKAPLAISTVNQSNLDQLGLDSLQDLATAVPDLQISANGYTPQLSIRGIGNFSGSYSTVAVQIDGIYQPTAASGELANGLFDVSRIEVARGPQGTLYGRNATAGVVNIYTADPTKQFEAYGDVAFGNYGDITTRAILNVPINDRIQMRGSIVRETNDGYYPGGAAGRNYGKTDILSGQITTLVQLTGSLQWRVALEHSSNTGTVNYMHVVNYLHYPDADLATGALGEAVIVPSAPFNLINQLSETDNSIDSWYDAVRSRLLWSVNNDLTVTYLAGFLSFVDNGVDSANGAFSQLSRGTDTRSMTHEVDVNFESGPVNSVLGLYYYKDYSGGDSVLHIGNTVPAPLNSLVSEIFTSINHAVGDEPSDYGLIDITQHTIDSQNVSKAVFTQTTYSLTPHLRLTGGVRYTADAYGLDETQQICAFGSAVAEPYVNCTVPFTPPQPEAQTTSSHNVSWKAGLDYDLTQQQLLYGTVDTGYRAGGVSGNVELPAQYLTYRPETVTNYEIGWKAALLHRSLAVSADVFDMEYSDMQVSAIEHDLTGTPTPVTINAGKSRIKGIEAEADWRLTAVDEIHAYATYLDARFTSFPDGVDSVTNPDGIYNTAVGILDGAGASYAPVATNVPTNFTGKRLPNAPEETFRVAYQHTFGLGGHGTVTPEADVYWQAGTYNDFANSAQAATAAYSRSDINLTYRNESGRLSIDAYVHNLENHTIRQSANGKWDETTAFYLSPRLFGVRIGYKIY